VFSPVYSGRGAIGLLILSDIQVRITIARLTNRWVPIRAGASISGQCVVESIYRMDAALGGRQAVMGLRTVGMLNLAMSGLPIGHTGAGGDLVGIIRRAQVSASAV
jgi:hypothetical protein